MGDTLPKIVAAALELDGVTMCMKPPARHHTIINALYRSIGAKCVDRCVEGFVTDEGEFMDRKTARILVRLNGQKIIRDIQGDELFSEHLW